MFMAVQQHEWGIEVPHHAGGARLARKNLATQLDDRVPPALLADAVTVAAELLGNAVRHAAALPGGVIRLSCRVGRTATGGVLLELRVSDGGSALVPTERSAGPDAVDGRGLAIVRALAAAWGVEDEGNGQCVWAALRLAETSRY